MNRKVRASEKKNKLFWDICSDRTMRIIHVAAVESENQSSWEMYFEDMIERDLRHPLLVVSDGGKGAQAAIVGSFPKADRQRGIAHKLRNIEPQRFQGTDRQKYLPE